MTRNTGATLTFAGLLALIAVASLSDLSGRVNEMLGKDGGVNVAGEQMEAAGGAAAPDTSMEEKPAEAAQSDEAAATKEAAAPDDAATPDQPSGEASGDEPAPGAAAQQPAEEAEAGQPAEETGAEKPADAAAATDEASASETVPEGGTQEVAKAQQIIIPTFDLVRVEPDGSTLIAGHSAPSAEIEILSGSEVIAGVKAEANGDFVAVLDDPLAPGDYELVLRATEEDGDVVMSTQTAVVSVPEAGHEGELLALVEEPGQPSRLINTPKPEAPKAADMPAASETAQATEEPEAQEPAAPSADEQPSPADEQTEIASLPAGDETEPAAPAQEQAEAPAPAKDDAKAPAVLVRIEAVEIDGETIFVAGAADAGTQVRVYANEILLGDTIASEGGRFLVQVNKDLPVGDYIIRADVIDPATAAVKARAAVPFTRREGQHVAAVASNVEPTPPAPASDGAATAGSEAAPAPSRPTDEVAEAPAADEPGETAQAPSQEEPAATQQDAGETPSAAKPEEPAGQVETDGAAPGTDKPAMADAGAQAPAGGEAGQPAKQDEAVAGTAAPAGSDAAEAETGKTETAAAAPAAPADAGGAQEAAAPAQAEAPAAANGGTEVAAVNVPEQSATLPAGPPLVSSDITVEGELQPTDSSVIIRRGDTLWQISRRVYGRGIRYTTIYLANQDQIKDPDMIWPGQIFALPEKSEN